MVLKVGFIMIYRMFQDEQDYLVNPVLILSIL